MAEFATTQRLKLRSYDPARDEQNFVEVIFTYDNLRIGSRDLAPMRPKDRTKLLETIDNSLFFAIVETLASPGTEAGQFVGSFVLKGDGAPRNRTATLGIAFVKEHQNKGYGTEVLRFLLLHAFDHLGLHRVQLEVRANNDRAIALYKKVYVPDTSISIPENLLTLTSISQRLCTGGIASQNGLA